jgi:hypothetical protein
MVSVGYVDLGTSVLRLGRLGHTLTHAIKWLAAGVIAAPIAVSVAVEIGRLVVDSNLSGLPAASPSPPLPPAVPSNELRSIVTASEAEPATRAVVTLQSDVSPQSTTPSESQPTESRVEATLPQIGPGSEYGKSVYNTAAPELPSTATSQSTLIAKPEPSPELPPINRVPLHVGKVVVADRAGFLFADSSIRFLARAELQELSPDQLHIARNEIFARKGRYFRDDALRSYFSQFLWYKPRAWEVALSPVEQANVGLIQSIEAPATASHAIAGPLPAQAKVENGAASAYSIRRYLTPEELRGLSSSQLVIVRNEIVARRGRYFRDDALRSYFSQFPWYQPHAWDVPLSSVDQANVKLVQSLEQGAPLPRQAVRTWRGPPM